MSNFAAQLKSEIQCLCRKEIRSETASLRKSVPTYRTVIAALKRRIAVLETALKKLSKPAPTKIVESEQPGMLRWRAPGFASLRKKLELSAADMGKLLGVTGTTIYAWEAGKSKPRPAQLASITRIRKLGKREAAEILTSLP
jgi:DNA-binding transcriptional regulator YiaG